MSTGSRPHHGMSEDSMAFQRSPDRRSIAARRPAAWRLSGETVHIADDVMNDPDYTVSGSQAVRRIPHASWGYPCCRAGAPIGVISLTRTDVRPFTHSRSSCCRRLPTRP